MWQVSYFVLADSLLLSWLFAPAPAFLAFRSLSVVVSLIYVVINSARFKEIMGEGGTLGTNMRLESEWHYRFAKPRNGLTTTWSGASADHPSYWNSARGATHFIGPKEPYPQ